MVDPNNTQQINMTITEILQNALTVDKVKREDAESKLQNLALRNFPEFLYNLSTELADESKPTKIRQMAATYIKNSITVASDLKEIWVNKLDSSVKEQIKNLVLSTLATKFKEVRAAAGLVIAGICRVDQPLTEKWPGLISSLTQSAYNENINIRLAAIESLGYVCEELTSKTIDTVSVDSILSALIQNISSCINNVEIVSSSLKAFFHCVRLAEKNFSRQNELEIIMETIFLAGNTYVNDDYILEKIALIFIEIASIGSYYDYISEYVNKIAEFTFYLLKNKSSSNEKLSLLAFEFWCSLGDEEVQRYKNEYSYNIGLLTNQVTSSISSNKPLRKYFTNFYTQMIEIIIEFVSVVDDEEEEDSDTWTLAKASSYILHVLVQVIDSDMMEKILLYIDSGLVSDDIKHKNTSLLLFAGSCDVMTHKNRVNDFISKHFNKILKFLFHEKMRIRKSASLLLIKITKYYGKSGLLNQNVLNTCVPLLINALPSTNKIAINVCQTLINITKAVGDLDTYKSQNPMSPHFEKLFSELVSVAYREGAYNKDENLTMYCFLLINELIEYSSHDKQEKLTEILIYFLTQFEGTLSTSVSAQINSMSTPGSSDIILNLQSYYCTIFRAVFKKMKRQIKAEMGGKIYTLIENSFLLRQTVYDEAILALGALATNMKDPFEEIFIKFQEYLLYSLKRFNESTLCKSALITLGHIIVVVKSNFSNYADKFVPILIEILTHEDVSRNNKTIAITTLGEICMNISEHFLKYIDSVMEVFFSAANMATSQPDLDDDETADYLEDLRFNLIEAFTCIEFGLDECGKKELFARYVPNIFQFFKTIIGDEYSKRPDVLKSMLAFITDMANMFGKEIRSICNKEFVKVLISKLRAFRIKRFDSDINQQEEILRLVLEL